MKRMYVVLMLVAVVMSASAGAADVVIVNAGFEDPVHADGEWNYQYPGWGAVNNVGEQSLGTWNPDATGDIFYGYNGNAPEGQNVAWVSGDDSGDVGLAQVLTDTLAEGMTYTLTVEVGNNYYYDWAGYKVQLLAGGTLLAEDNSSQEIATDTFELSTVMYTYDQAQSALLGQALEIRLLAVPGTGEVDFDDVMLTAVPEPISLGLFGMGTMCLIRRRRK